ncbi:MAG: hypothetical protein DRP60_13240 [Spirochaetes bacterium]|nr:MAG: hypothetical protein DRP60_13240 [Spirochaetota bacterium]
MDPGNRYFRVYHLLEGKKSSWKFDEGKLISPADCREDDIFIAESDVLKGFVVNVKELFETIM